jgi:hypothetical protein
MLLGDVLELLFKPLVRLLAAFDELARERSKILLLMPIPAKSARESVWICLLNVRI